MIALLMAGGLSLAASLVGTRYLIVWLQQHQIGQHIREEGPEGHQMKAGTPTMGGIAIVVGAVIGYSVAHLRSRVVFTRWAHLAPPRAGEETRSTSPRGRFAPARGRRRPRR
mgnify:CR=1 FL=1